MDSHAIPNVRPAQGCRTGYESGAEDTRTCSRRFREHERATILAKRLDCVRVYRRFSPPGHCSLVFEQAGLQFEAAVSRCSGRSGAAGWIIAGPFW